MDEGGGGTQGEAELSEKKTNFVWSVILVFAKTQK